MSLILAIEPDQRQAAQLADLIRGRLNADLVHARTTEGALTALAGIGDRVPDLVLVPSLLSAQEDAAIAGALRLIATAANVQMLTIPRLEDPEQPAQARGVFAKLRGRKTRKTPNGCDPAVFADQIASYLAEAAAARRAQQADDDLVASAEAPRSAPVADAAPTSESLSPAPGEFLPDPVLDFLAATVPASPGDPIVDPVLAAIAAPVGDAAPVVDVAPVVEVAPVVDAARESVVAPVIDPISEPFITPLVESTVEPFDAPVPNVDIPQPAAITEVYAPLVLGRPPGLNPADETQPLIRAAAVEPIVVPSLSETTKAPDVIVLEEPPAAMAIGSEDVVAESDEPRVVAMADDVPALSAVQDLSASLEPAAPAATASDPAHVVSRRRRKATRPPATKPADTFDIDALLAPLLSELAAKRRMPAQREKPRAVTAANEEAAPAAATSTPEPSVVAPRPARVLPPPPPAAQEEPAVRVEPPISLEPVVSLEPAAALEPAAFVEPVLAPAASVVEEPVVAFAAAEPDVDPMFFAQEVPAATSEPPPHDRPAWVELIESLRQDIERLKAEQVQIPGAASVVAREAEPPRIGRILSIAPAPAARHPEPVGASGSRIHKLTPRTRAPRPVQDQWGLFDPEQCGFAALRAKLDEISARDEVSA